MKKIATATIATAGFATFGLMQHDADAAENNNNGYNPNDPYSYEYTYTIDQQGNYNYDWKGNWSPNQQNQQNQQQAQQPQQGNYYSYSYGNQGTQSYNSNNATTNNNQSTQSYTANNSNNQGGGLGADYSTSDKNIKVTTQNAPSSNNSTAFSGQSSSGSNAYTAGQCTYYVYDKVGGKISSNWGNASNWANAAAQDGYNVSNSPKQGAIMQTSQGAYGHVAYVENVNSDGSIKVSEMNYNGGPGNVSTRTISASQAGSYNYIS
ncbi:CHAP domain-containing protein [Staphylococcus pasteuri]|uniref:Surface antigen n=2 Tax=Staphylococcus TaxID=1279 RepID=A0ABY1H7H7_9STAP|nr:MULTISPECIES: CHAP domain-containing protein [Staphylococcus]ODB63321.1 CHAP domain-containing protein [Staphylococcus sp. AOAB]ATH61709.1 CHAP domain-containing protein [Staphylococcus pasteuri]KKI55993.1 Secretory antigen precursor SsaA [Staphylococcus pasteuri]MBL3398994.1 CHAP domain-containing protein [Staphylococcus pasteuri]MBM6508335.1 CHAP domain-containing protein [Staphylococcus pasteuri]